MQRNTSTIRSIQSPCSIQDHWQFINQLNQYSFFHTPNWIQVLTETYRQYKNSSFIVTFKNGKSALIPAISVCKFGGLVKSIHSMPFNTYGGLLSNDEITSQESFEIGNLLFQSRVIKTSLTPDPSISKQFISGTPYSTAVKRETQLLPLNLKYEDIWTQKYDGKNRNQIRKARNSSIHIEVNPTQAGSMFSELYHRNSELRGSNQTLVYSSELFTNLEIYPEQVKFYMAYHSGDLISAILVLYGKNHAIYWAAANKPEAKSLCANQLLLDYAIQQSCEMNIGWFDFGASHNMPQLWTFKEGFGPEPKAYSILSSQLWMSHKIYED